MVGLDRTKLDPTQIYRDARLNMIWVQSEVAAPDCSRCFCSSITGILFKYLVNTAADICRVFSLLLWNQNLKPRHTGLIPSCAQTGSVLCSGGRGACLN